MAGHVTRRQLGSLHRAMPYTPGSIVLSYSNVPWLYRANCSN